MVTKTADELERDVAAAEEAFEADPTPEREATLRSALRASGATDDDADHLVHGLRYGGFGLM